MIIGSESQTKIRAKVLQMSAEMGGLKKDGTNKHQGFSFVSHDALTSEMKKIAVKHKVQISFDQQLVQALDKNRIVSCDIVFFDTESGEWFGVSSVGEGSDNQDKATYKASTQSVKVGLLKNMLIPAGDKFADGDYGLGYDEDDDDAAESAAPKKKSKSKSASKSDEEPQQEDESQHLTIEDKLALLKMGKGQNEKRAGSLANKLGLPVKSGLCNFDAWSKKQQKVFSDSLDTLLAREAAK